MRQTPAGMEQMPIAPNVGLMQNYFYTTLIGNTHKLVFCNDKTQENAIAYEAFNALILHDNNMSKRLLMICLCLWVAACLKATAGDPVRSCKGYVSDAETGEPLVYATVVMMGQWTYSALSDENGFFIFEAIPEGEYELQASYIGYKQLTRKVTLDGDATLMLQLHQESSALAEVVVTAHESSGIVSSSTINRDMMTHLQPTSFSDLLELLPGNISKTPSMGEVNSMQLRETGTLGATGTATTNTDYTITSLGTLFVVDGAPLITDANLQNIPGTSDATSPHYTRNSTNKGVDMRTISTDDIESVEIVRGIPSAEYGNLTSGMVNIKRIRRETPWTARFKADEYSKLLAVGKGYAFNKTNTVLNVDLGYLDSKVDPRNNLENYKRINFSARLTQDWAKDAWKLSWQSSVDYTGSIDDVKNDPDLSYGGVDTYKSSYNRFSAINNLDLKLNQAPWLKLLALNTSVSYEKDRLERTKLVSPQRATVAPSQWGEGVSDGTFLFSEYIADYVSDGRPLNAFLKAKTEMQWKPDPFKVTLRGGLEWNYSKNLGLGQIYDPSKPLSASWTTRPRAYRDIPALQNIASYVETNTTARIGKHEAEIQAGVRTTTMVGMDKRYLLQGKPYLDPRINAQWRFPEIRIAGRPLDISLSGGFGLTTKMPTLDYLYPDLWYNDIVQLNYYDANNPLEYSRVNIITYVEDITNYDLKPARNTKWEARADLSYNGNRLSVTWFREDLTSGFRYSSYYAPFAYREYDSSAIDASSLDGPPELDDIPYTETSRLDGYRQASNGSRLLKEGVEFQFSSQRIKPLRTAIVINGAWFRTTYTNSLPMFETVSDVVDNKAVSDKYVGLYDWNNGRVNEQFNTNFMLDTQVPEWGLIFSTAVQCVWYVSTQQMWRNGVPVSYLSAEDGQLHPYTEESANDAVLQFLIKTYNDATYNKQTIPIALYVNLKVTKTIGKWIKLSLFANRLIDYLPDYTSNGVLVRRNVDPYFGMEVSFTL